MKARAAFELLLQAGKHIARDQVVHPPRADHRKRFAVHELVPLGLAGLPVEEVLQTHAR